MVHDRGVPSPQDLLRLFDRTEQHFAAQVGQAAPLEVGTAIFNPAIPLVHDANHVRDVSLPEGMSAAAAYELVEQHYARAGTRCAFWVMNPSAPPQATGPMVEFLTARGYEPSKVQIMHLSRLPRRV